jgi:hypothetical protein
VQIEQFHWSSAAGWQPRSPGASHHDTHLVLAFGSRPLLQTSAVLGEIRQAYPKAFVTGCSTAGEICGEHVFDDTVVVTAFRFEKSTCAGVSVTLSEAGTSDAAGALLASRLPHHDQLRHVVVFSDGLQVNGTDLVRGLGRVLPSSATVTGGLSADGPHFTSTCVVVDGVPETGAIVAVGFYGAQLSVGCGCLGGWDPFGPNRVITRSQGNVLYELDGQSALALYKRYLGDQARDLPASGLLFPLSVRAKGAERGVVRTILGVSDADDSMTFAGDIPEGAYAQLMRANFDRLIDGAVGAARVSAGGISGHPTEWALLISCVGRKMILQQRIEEEVEGVRDVVGPQAILTGFYSYGEISPYISGERCELHNQAMAITTFSER